VKSDHGEGCVLTQAAGAQKGAIAALDSIDGDVEITAKMWGSQICPTQ
jgi:hypothetical protein